jgi:II/X family phage/plasmid replication protein
LTRLRNAFSLALLPKNGFKILIDWLTLKLDGELLTEQQHVLLRAVAERKIHFAGNGEILSHTSAWQRLRSDTMGITFHYTSNSLTICGSPASVMHSNNVFGSDNIVDCFTAMLDFFKKETFIALPRTAHFWTCSRIDITNNYDLGGQTEVKQALEMLKYATTRGNNVERRHTTIYWNKGSKIRMGKAYNKYEHAKKMQKDNKHFYSPEQLELTKKLLRLELTLGLEFIRRQRELKIEWYQMTAQILQLHHKSFFAPTVGNIDVPTVTDLHQKLVSVAPSNGLALSALNCFLMIQSLGVTTVKESMSKTTFYRNRKLLILAGLTNADLNAGRILEFRTKSIELGQAVQNWTELERLHA